MGRGRAPRVGEAPKLWVDGLARLSGTWTMPGSITVHAIERLFWYLNFGKIVGIMLALFISFEGQKACLLVQCFHCRTPVRHCQQAPPESAPPLSTSNRFSVRLSTFIIIPPSSLFLRPYKLFTKRRFSASSELVDAAPVVSSFRPSSGADARVASIAPVCGSPRLMFTVPGKARFPELPCVRRPMGNRSKSAAAHKPEVSRGSPKA